MRFLGLLSQHETLIGIVIFGATQMLADTLADLERGWLAASVRILGILLLIGILIYSIRQRRQVLKVPLLFTEEERRDNARVRLRTFAQKQNMACVLKLIDKSSPVYTDDLFIQMLPAVSSAPPLRNDRDPAHWEQVALQILREWDEEVDKHLKRWAQEHFGGYLYHLCPHIVLPMAFFLGASVGLRRKIVLYQPSEGGVADRAVIDLSTSPRRVLDPPENPVQGFQETRYEGQAQEGEKQWLILHCSLGRHPVQFQSHPHYEKAMNVGIYLPGNLPETGDWLPYVQTVYQKAKGWVDQYQQVQLCLACPSTIAFALGMAFSRTPKITVCHWFEGQYQPVLSLSLIERKLPFD